jgi:membrane-associated phospholipid phosphatase
MYTLNFAFAMMMKLFALFVALVGAATLYVGAHWSKRTGLNNLLF